jgi:CheY-like chemotaxis protein
LLYSLFQRFEEDFLTDPRVLIVDDDETFRLIARESLHKKGFIVEEAVNGDQALVIALRSKPDIVLVDIMMPGVDGVSLCREFRERAELKDTILLVVTALNDPKILRDAVRFGANAYLIKPVEASVLLDKVKKLLASRPAS